MVSTTTLIYIGHFLSSWGDRMWQFAVPLFLLNLEHKSLSLTAAYGLTVASSVLLFGPLIGGWIDRKPRLYAARMSLIIQNSTVILCALLFIFAKDRNSSYIVFVKIGAILLGCVTQLASTATVIIIQKDWIVVVAGGNQEMLANLNSVTRRIDLVTKILAPAACGQIMSLLSLSDGAIFIMAWNAASMFVEYFILRVVYKRTPSLSRKGGKRKTEDNQINEIPLSGRGAEGEERADVTILTSNDGNEKVVDKPVNNMNNEHMKSGSEKSNEIEPQKNENNQQSNRNVEPAILEVSDVNQGLQKEHTDDTVNLIEGNSNNSIKTFFQRICKASAFRKMFAVVIILKDGWKFYVAQPIALPCFGFSFLYMTLLGFGYITIAYEYSQCFSEFTVGLFQGGAAITGIFATFMYPIMRRRLGLIKTGVLSAVIQLSTLIPCIISVFIAGSPFYLLPSNQAQQSNDTVSTSTSSSFVYVNTASVSTIYPNNFTSTEESPAPVGSQLFLKCPSGISPPSSYLSMALLMTGIILARIGLWGFDLTITQLIQESVAEDERGVFSGVQSSLNNLMDLLTYIFVLALPLPSQFGILVFVSSVSVTTGYIMFFIYANRSSRTVATKLS